jgi:hypothetical protein
MFVLSKQVTLDNMNVKFSDHRPNVKGSQVTLSKMCHNLVFDKLWVTVLKQEFITGNVLLVEANPFAAVGAHLLRNDSNTSYYS